jgi:signal transduction histidine kinase
LVEVAHDVQTVQHIPAVPSILKILCETTGMGFAAVARVTEQQWVACQVLDNIHFGLAPGGELELESTLCAEVRMSRAEVIIDHADEDPVYSCHLTPQRYGFQSYVSVPIILPSGEFFGTLCAIDPRPHALKGSSSIEMFRLFAQLIGFHIDADQKLTTSERSLAGTQADLQSSQSSLATSQEALQLAQLDGNLREQFIAVLGHDLRNPLAAISAGVRMLGKDVADPRKERILRHMDESAKRMFGLIDNLLDFARGRLGGGIGLDIKRGMRIEPVLAQVINELQAGHSDRVIETRFKVDQPVDCDHVRISQLLSNLLGNAIMHGDAGKPILVEASCADGRFALSVANGGKPIPSAMLDQLFQPFYRGETRPSLQGLGLGLYIASQIAKAHHGDLTAVSDPTETRFTFSMPLN